MTGLTGYDSVYYLGIASEGYHLAPITQSYRDWAFFPAYPLLVRAADLVLPGSIAVAGLLVANTALLLGMLLVARLMGDAGQAQAVRPAMWLLVFAPGAAAFGMAYSDSLLLAASAGALLAVRRDRTWVAALLLSVATLARPPGILLVVPLAVAIVQRQGRITWHLAALATGPVCLALFAAYQGAVLGDPLAFLHAQAAWTLPSITQGGSGVAAPSSGVVAVAALLDSHAPRVHSPAAALPAVAIALAGEADGPGGLRERLPERTSRSPTPDTLGPAGRSPGSLACGDGRGCRLRSACRSVASWSSGCLGSRNCCHPRALDRWNPAHRPHPGRRSIEITVGRRRGSPRTMPVRTQPPRSPVGTD